MANSVTSAKGCDVKCSDDSGFQEAVSAAQKAQAVIVIIGLDGSQERSMINFMLSTLKYYSIHTVRVMIVLI